MKIYTIYIILICACIIPITHGCGPRITKQLTHQELPDQSNDTLSDWSKTLPGLQGTAISIDVKHPRSVYPNYEKNNKINLCGWKGEKISAQILLWNTKATQNLECSFSDFASSEEKISANIAKARFVRYVMSEEENYDCKLRKEGDFLPVLMPDLIDSLTNFSMEPLQSRPVWISIDIPADAPAGKYVATLKVDAAHEESLNFEINLEVQDRVLPPPSQWDYHLDLWQHPSAEARIAGVELWSDEHFEQMRPNMKMLADAGQKVITATLNKDPWNNQCFDAYEKMIVWEKNEDNTWSYDYSAFDKWVKFMLSLGIDKMINCYSMIPWNNELEYFDTNLGQNVTIVANPGSNEFIEMWTPFLTDFVEHLRNNGWLDITNIAMDESSPEMMDEAIKLLHTVAPQLGIALADNHKSFKKYPFIKDICIIVSAKIVRSDFEIRKENGLNTTFYVCCGDKFPNMFTFSPSAESCYSAWYSYAAGFDGMLRWTYNSWPENPEIDSRFRKFPAGDTFFVYPFGRSSIRFERLKEGIQDVEKIKILKSTFNEDNSSDAKEKLNMLNDIVEKFNTKYPSDISTGQMLNDAKEKLNMLSR